MSATPSTVVNSDNLKAFQSGIGSGFDLMIEKQLEKDYAEDFNVIASVIGHYQQETKEYFHQPFQYRVKATGDQIIKTSTGFAVIHAEATPVHPVRVTVEKAVAIPVTIRIRIRFKVEYFVRTNNGVEVRTKTLYTKPITFETGYNRFTVNEQGVVALTPYDSEEVSSTPISQYVNEAIQKDSDIVKSMESYPITAYGYEVQDDYPFDITNPYRHNVKRDFQSSSLGSFNVAGDYIGSELNLNSTLKAYGIANAGLFYGRKVINQEVSIRDGAKVVLLSFTDFKAIPLVNVDDPSYIFTNAIYDSSNPRSVHYHLGQIENPENFKLYANSYHNITRNDFLIIEPKGISKSNQTTYQFGEEESYFDIAYHKLIPTIGQDPLARYHYKLTVMDCSSNITINNKPVKPQQVIRTTGTGVGSFTIVSQFKNQAIPWTLTLPSPDGDAPFSGSVNGGNYLVDYGKRDYQTYIPTFAIPSNVENVRFEIVLEGIIGEAPISIRFENESSPGIGTENGGQVTLSSEMFGYRTREFSHIVSQANLKGFKISGLAEQTYTTIIYKESDTNFSYSRFEMELKTDNNDVRITDYPKSVQFQNGEYTFPFKARIQQNAVSRWSPRIHSGFYYLNQHEYYMPSSFDAQADYDMGTHFNVEKFRVALRAEFVKSEAKQPISALLTSEHDYRNNADRFQYFGYERLGNKEWIYARPIIQTDYYERYSDLEYISPIKTLNGIVEVWNSITWNEEVTKTETLVLQARVYDLIKGKWTGWTTITNGGKPKLVPSNLIQFKAKLSFNQSVEPMKTITEYKQTAMDYRAIMDTENSRNIALIDGEARPLNSTMPATFCTKVIDYGTAVNLMANYTSKTGGMKCYLGASQEPTSLTKVNNLPLYAEGSKINNCRYYRMKFELSANDSLYQLATTIEIAPLKKASIRFGGIRINGVKRSHSKRHTALEDYEVSLKMDGLPHELLPDMSALLKACVAKTEFGLNDLYYYQFTSAKPNVVLSYSSVDPKTSLVGQSTVSQINSSHAPMVRFNNGRTVIKALPEQFSPILVEHETYGPLQEVFFFKNGVPSLDYETVLKLSLNKTRLQHHHIDERTIEIYDNTDQRKLTRWKIENSFLRIEEAREVKSIRIKYRLRNSFISIVDEPRGQVTLCIHTDKPLDSSKTVDKALVSFETNLTTNKRVLSHLSFNPLYNTQYEGFVYLSNTLEMVETLKVSANPTLLKPKKADHVTVYVQALDRYGNPVPGETIQVSETVGELESIQGVTDQNGVAVYRYHSPREVGREMLVFKTASGVREELRIQIQNPTT